MGDDPESIVLKAYIKKVKTNKEKFFVLHKDGHSGPARLEYYDKKVHWESKKRPKKTIQLQTCFSINAISDSKSKFGLKLYTKDDSFQVSFETETKRDSWLATIRALINTKDAQRPMYQHVWNVRIPPRLLGKNYEGEHRLCLNERTVMLVKKNSVDPVLEFPLEVIRRCGHTGNFFNLEVGRQASTGAGEFWMQVDDDLIAENVHHAIIANMNRSKDERDTARLGRGHKDKHSTSSSYRERQDKAKSQTFINSPSSVQPQQRSDSVSSRGTASSYTRSTDNLPDINSIESSHTRGRSLTPDPRNDEMNNSIHEEPRSAPPFSWNRDHSTSMTSVNSNRSTAVEPRSDMGSINSSDISSYVPMEAPNNHSDNNYFQMSNPSRKSTTGSVDIISHHDDDPYCDMHPSDIKKPANIPSYLRHDPELDDIQKKKNPLYVDMAEADAYMEMTPGNRSDKYSSTSSVHSSQLSEDRNKNPYIDMSMGSSTSLKDLSSRLECMSIDSNQEEPTPQRHYSVGSRPTKLEKAAAVDQYVEMTRNKEKSVSVPQLIPLSLSSNPDLSHLHDDLSRYRSKRNPNYNAEYVRPRTSSENFGRRPRNTSLTPLVRHASHKQQQNNRVGGSEYMDMNIGSQPDAYVEMSPNNMNSHRHMRNGRKPMGGKLPEVKISQSGLKSAGLKKGSSRDSSSEHIEGNSMYEGRELPSRINGRRTSQPYRNNEPFPELSASSEEDIRVRRDGSFSSSKSTSSSRSSLMKTDSGSHSRYGSNLETEPYLDCSISPSSRPITAPQVKPVRVSSFISEDPKPNKSRRETMPSRLRPSEQPSDYMKMSPGSVTRERSPNAQRKIAVAGINSQSDNYADMAAGQTPVVQSKSSSHIPVTATKEYMDMDPSEKAIPEKNSTPSVAPKSKSLVHQKKQLPPKKPQPVDESYADMTPGLQPTITETQASVTTALKPVSFNSQISDPYADMVPGNLPSFQTIPIIGDYSDMMAGQAPAADSVTPKRHDSGDAYADIGPTQQGFALAAPLADIQMTASNSCVASAILPGGGLSSGTSRSDMSTIGSQTERSTGSGGSGSTVCDDYTPMDMTQSDGNKFERKDTIVNEKTKTPNKGICLLRQTSRDDFIGRYQHTPCLIRLHSTTSMVGDEDMAVGASAAEHNIADDILSAIHETNQDSFPPAGITAPLPLKVARSQSDTSTKVADRTMHSPTMMPAYSRHISMENRPGSQTGSDSDRLSTIASSDAGSDAMRVISFIRDAPKKTNNMTLPKTPSFPEFTAQPNKTPCMIQTNEKTDKAERNRKPPPSLPNRRTQPDEAAQGVLVYAELDHSSNDTQVVSSPSPHVDSHKNSTTNYTTIDRKATEEHQQNSKK